MAIDTTVSNRTRGEESSTRYSVSNVHVRTYVHMYVLTYVLVIWSICMQRASSPQNSNNIRISLTIHNGFTVTGSYVSFW